MGQVPERHESQNQVHTGFSIGNPGRAHQRVETDCTGCDAMRDASMARMESWFESVRTQTPQNTTARREQRFIESELPVKTTAVKCVRGKANSCRKDDVFSG